MANQENLQPGSYGTLNVLLHGSFAFIQDKEPKQIRALVPDIDHHVCRAGSWLAETDVVAGKYKLVGVNSGQGTFDPARNLIVTLPKPPDNPQARAILTFPQPKQITSLRVGDIPRALFVHAEELASSSVTQHIATLHVFTYDIDIKDATNLCLKASDGNGHYWEPVFAGSYVNLHIFSAEDHIEEPSHAIEDFEKCAQLLGLSLSLQGTLLASEIPPDNHLPDGVTAEETEDLAPRTLRMARLGRLVSGNGDANLAWYGNDALDGNPEACGGPIGY